MRRRSGLIFNRGQIVTEYAIVVGLLAAATFVGIATYVRRGLQARYRTVVDGAANALVAPTQYEPYYLPDSTSVERSSESRTVGYHAGVTSVSLNDSQTVTEEATSRSADDLAADNDWQ